MGERAGQFDLEHLMFEMLICCLGFSKGRLRQDQVGKRLPGNGCEGWRGREQGVGGRFPDAGQSPVKRDGGGDRGGGCLQTQPF